MNRHDDRYERRRRDDDHWQDNERDYPPHRNRSNSYHHEEDRHRDGKRRRMSDLDEVDLNRRPRFPAPFETCQADYVLDPTTGYFYEEWSDFFHDPKSKLYFYNGSKRYYSFDKDDDRYISVKDEYGKLKMKISQGKEAEVDKGNDLIVQALQGSQKTEAAGGKLKISIMIKQKPKKGKKSERKDESGRSRKEIMAVAKRIEEQTQKQKKHSDDIEKWSKRVKESEGGAESTDNKNFAHSHAFANPINGKIKKTKSGKPVCLLCKRKFVSVEKIEQHVLLSELHKYNLSRMKSNGNQNATTYIDRAQNRRSMYEKEQQPIPIMMDAVEVKEIMAPSLEKSRDIVSTQAVRPEDNLGESNIGNKMLQKLGWKEGQSLGRFGGDGRNNNLKSDWEKIESMAASSTPRTRRRK